jgi:phosphodiesterase/alkaline phosphatase D-like protein
MAPMNYARALLLALVATLLLAPPALAARGFKFGVTAGEVTSKSAQLWGKANKSGVYGVVVATNRRFRGNLHAALVRARKGHDNTVQRRVTRLKANERYWFRFVGTNGRRSAVGTFVTAPLPKRNVTVEFAWSGDQDFNSARGETTPYWNNGGVLRRMKAERNDFNVMLGDTIYSDSEVPDRLRPIALSVKQKWAKYKLNLRNRSLRALRRSAGFYSHWDDHEFVNDYSPAENSFDNGVNVNGRRLYRRGAKAFRDYAPVRWSERNGLYRKIRWGRNLELFFLDERSFRSANADANHVCDNPQTGRPDFAPTAPQSTRNVFAVASPSLAEPVSQACLDAIRNPDRTFLGQRQLERFLRDVKLSTARFKVIMNEMPIQQYYVLPYDRWEGFEAERQQVLLELQGVKNLVFLSTDVHATLVNDARFQTLESGGAKDSGIMDVTVGPVATANFGLEIDDTVDRPGTGALVDSLFFTPPPPNGLGMRCSIVDQFSYGQVTVTGSRLTITPKGIDGQPQQDGANPCGPFVFNYQP